MTRMVPIFAALLLASCSKEPAPAAGIPAGTFAGGGRDGLCISGLAGAQRAGFVVYGPGDTNCSASGRIVKQGAGWTLVPAGEGDCKIPFTVGPGTISLGRGSPSCAYYCAPGVSFDAKSFGRVQHASKLATDLAGDPLC